MYISAVTWPSWWRGKSVPPSAHGTPALAYLSLCSRVLHISSVHTWHYRMSLSNHLPILIRMDVSFRSRFDLQERPYAWYRVNVIFIARLRKFLILLCCWLLVALPVPLVTISCLRVFHLYLDTSSITSIFKVCYFNSQTAKCIFFTTVDLLVPQRRRETKLEVEHK